MRPSSTLTLRDCLLVLRARFELTSPDYKTGILPIEITEQWKPERDSNPRFYGFAIRCIGPLCHLAIDCLAVSKGFEPLCRVLADALFSKQAALASRATHYIFFFAGCVSGKLSNHNLSCSIL